MKREIPLLLAAILLWRPAFSETGVTPSEILLGACAPLSGPVKALGTNVVAGGKVYLRHVNDSGGVHGRKLKLLERDDKWSPEEAISCFKELMKEGVFAGAFFAGAPQSVNYSKMAELNKTPFMVLSGLRVLHSPFKRYTFTVRGTFNEEAELVIDRLWEDAGLRKFGIISQEDALGAAIKEAVTERLAKHASKPVAMAFVRRGAAIDPAAVNAAMHPANPEVVLLGAGYATLAPVIRKIKTPGWNPVLVVMTRGGEGLLKELGSEAEGLVFAQGLPPAGRTDLKTIALYRSLLKKYMPGAEPSQDGLEGFMQGIVLVEALKRAGKELDREKFISAVESIQDFDAGLGPRFKVDYGPDRHRGMTYFAYTTVKDGKVVEISDWKSLKKQR